MAFEPLTPLAPSLGQTAMVATFEQRLDELHEMLYRRGGVRPVNAAIEELTKLLLLQVVLQRHPSLPVREGLTLSDALSPRRIREMGSVEEPKAAFAAVIRSPDVAARVPGGELQPIWPLDEPLRITRADVLAEAMDIIAGAVSEHRDDGRYDPLGTAFDVFLRGRYDHAGGLGTHLTPHTVVTHLARLCVADLDLLAEPLTGPVVGDPCCGTGRFLLGALREQRSQLDLIDPADPARLDRERQFAALRENGLFGADQSASSVAKARVNLLLHGVAHPFVFATHDSITAQAVDELRGSLRLILTNPPFGDGKYDDPDGIARTAAMLPGVTRRSRIDPALAFVARCVDLLAPGGRLGIILPDGLVDGPALKRALVTAGETRSRDVSIEANISLPTATFALSGTVARTSAVVIRRTPTPRPSVFLARAQHVGYLKQSGVAVADPDGDDLPMITEGALSTWDDKTSREKVERNGVAFACQEPLAAHVLREGLVSVDPSRVDPPALAARAALREAEGLRFDELLEPIKRRATPARPGIPYVSVLHVDDLGAVAWNEAVNHSPTTPGQPAHPGEVLVSLLNPSKLRACVVPDAYPTVLCSSEFGVFRARECPWEALVLLHDERVKRQLAPLGRGTSSSRRRIEAADLLAVYAPRLESDRLASMAEDVRTALAALREATLRVAEIYDSLFSGSSSSSEVSAATTGTPDSLAATGTSP